MRLFSENISENKGYVVFVEAKDNNSTFVFEKDHQKVPIFVFSNDIPLGGEITIIRNSRNASNTFSIGFYLIGGVFNGLVQASIDLPTDA